MIRIFILFILAIFSSCSSPYYEHFRAEHPAVDATILESTGFVADGTLFTFPSPSQSALLTEAIQHAKEKIWIEIYTWTDMKEVTESILDAKSRGVDVQVLLEGNVYGTPTINQPIAKKLKGANIPIVYSDVERYTFTHAKFWIIDDVYYISTGNWTKSFFTKNREYIYRGNDPITLDTLSRIFIADMHHLAFKDTRSIPKHLVVSPVDARQKLIEFLRSANREVHIFAQTLGDREMLSVLQDIQSSGKVVHICTAESQPNRDTFAEFSNLEWKFAKSPYLHAKIILVDSGSVFLGSQNLTQNALDNNREVGMLLHGKPDWSGKIRADIAHDCK